jgi:hypothetical protein
MAKNWLVITGCLLAAVVLHLGLLSYRTNTIVTHRDGTITQNVVEKPVFGESTSVTIPAGTFEVGKSPPSLITIHAAYPRSFVSWETAVVGGLILPGLLLFVAWGRLVSKMRGWLCIGAAILSLLAAITAGAYAYAVIVAGTWSSFFADFLADQPGTAANAVSTLTNESFRIAAVTAVLLLLASIVVAVRGWRTRKPVLHPIVRR